MRYQLPVLLGLWLIVGLLTPGQAVGQKRLTLPGRPDSITTLQPPMTDSLRVADSAHFNEMRIESPQPQTPDSIFPADPGLFSRVPALDTILRTNRWALDETAWTYTLHPIDSCHLNAGFYDPYLPRYTPYSSLGLSYAPTLSDAFFERPTLDYATPFFMTAVYAPLRPTKHLYNSSGHLSIFSAAMGTSGDKGELNASWLFSQNITPDLNIGFTIHHGDDKAKYKNLESRLNGVEGRIAYTKKRLFVSGNMDYQKLRFADNGGIVDAKWLRDTVVDAPQIPVVLTKANTTINSLHTSVDLAFDLVQHHHAFNDSSGITIQYHEPALSIISLHTLSQYSRTYADDAPPETHPPYHISNSHTYDSTATLSYNGRIGIAYTHSPHYKIPLPSFRAWLGYVHDRYLAPSPVQYITGPKEQAQHSLYVAGSMDYNLRYIDLKVHAYSFFLGDRIGNSQLGGTLYYYPSHLRDKLNLSVSGKIDVARPAHFIRRYFSNTALWDKREDFGPCLSIDLGGKLDVPWWGGEYGANARQYRNYTYFDTLATPAQTKNLTVISAYAQQEFSRWGLTILARILYQQCTNSTILALPTLAGYATIGYQYEFIKNVFTLHLGLEAYYRTAYHAPVYNSPLGVFHNQEQEAIGNYPLMNVVLTVKWMQANVFIKVLHANQDLLSRNYFASIRYPEKERGFRIGVQWHFYK